VRHVFSSSSSPSPACPIAPPGSTLRLLQNNFLLRLLLRPPPPSSSSLALAVATSNPNLPPRLCVALSTPNFPLFVFLWLTFFPVPGGRSAKRLDLPHPFLQPDRGLVTEILSSLSLYLSLWPFTSRSLSLWPSTSRNPSVSSSPSRAGGEFLCCICWSR
jgi:hypothetical protein